MIRLLFVPACLCPFVPLFSGCGAPGPTMQRTALDSFDLETMTDDMARSIAADPDVQAALAREGQLKVVVLPVQNLLAGEVLPRGRAEIFTARLRMLLNRGMPRSFQWIMNRDYFYTLRGMELDNVDLGPAPEAINPDYALTATFESLRNEDKSRQQAYYLCVFELRDLRDRTLLWTDKYEVKKTAVKGWLD
jgi:hypothetical protein